MSRDWPDEAVGWFDEAGKAWCKHHEPAKGEYTGELTPALKTDTWLIELGVCAAKNCGDMIADFALDGE